MKIFLVLLSTIFISCSFNKENPEILETNKMKDEKKFENTLLPKQEVSFEKTQDSLRIILLKSKPNEILKASVLQELYIRRLVSQIDDSFKFLFPFNLHGMDCGAPDCFSTDISFEIPVTNPVQFPKEISFQLFEHGCVDQEIYTNGLFELVEESENHVNYYSKKHKSNLVIIHDEAQLYYFPNTQPNEIKVDSLYKLFENYDEEDSNAIVPYQSTTMTTNEYQYFLEDQ